MPQRPMEKVENSESRVHRIVFRAWCSFWPLFLGFWLPYVDFAGQHYLNLPWSFIYGLGLLGQEAVFGRSIVSPWNSFGMFVWPILVTAFLYWLSGRLWTALRPSRRVLLAGLLVVSGVFVADLNNPLSNIIPTYWWLTFDIW